MSLILESPADIMREQWLEKRNKSKILREAKMRYDYVLVDPDPLRNFYRMYGRDGTPIDVEVSTGYSKEYNSTSGRIVAMPSRIKNTKEWKSNILDGIEVGDRVYTHFNCIEAAKESGYGVEDEEGYMYVLIHVAMLYCAVRYPGEIMMISPNIFVQPIEEDESTTKTSSGIIIKPRAGLVAQRGKVTHVSPNNIGKPILIEPGDEIVFEQDCEFEMTIEGKKYYKQTHDNVMGIIEYE